MQKYLLPSLAFALAGAACGGKVVESTGGSTAESATGAGGSSASSADSSSGASGSSTSNGGDASSAGGGDSTMTGGTTGGAGNGGTGGGANTLCTEPGPLPPPGAAGGNPACKCADEAMILLPMLALAAQTNLGANGFVCGSAFPIPAVVPSGSYYVPWVADGMDFQTGDENNGWQCLQITMPETIHCQYSFTKGTSPVTSGHGGFPLAIYAESFEVAAEGDDDGDGIRSGFAIVANPDPSGQFIVEPMFIDQPDE
ncbi:MAG: hypothetical protein IPK82_34285 [Polyangiaceae bacterium]|nr:hypothetical protein [Polyangiaceae bacterium]